MRTALARVGTWSFLHPLRVLVAWLVVALVVVGLLATQPREISTSITLEGTPSQEARDLVADRLPDAGGTQGSLVFVADDAGRVDSPERKRAIAAAVEDATATGHLVDREDKLRDQRAEVRREVPATVDQKMAAQLEPQLAQLETSLSSQANQLRAAGASASPQGQAMAGELDRLASEARHLQRADPTPMVDGATRLFADLDALAEQAASSPTDLPLALPDLPEEQSDPRAAVDRAADKATRDALDRLDGLLRGSDPAGSPLRVDGRTWRSVEVSDDGTVAMATLQFTDELSNLPADAVDDVIEAAEEAAAPAGLSVAPSSSMVPEEAPVGGHEAIGLGIAVLVLALTLGSLLAAGLPVLTALLGVFLGVGTAFALSANYAMTTSTPALGLMIGLAVGIDYALFVVHKHRQVIKQVGTPAREAVGQATGSAGSAVVFAGSTVVIALLGLLTLGIGFVDVMAITAAGTVALAVLISLTLLPALLGLVGERIVSRRARERSTVREGSGLAGRWAGLTGRRPWLTMALVVVALLGLAWPATDLRLGMPSGATAEAGSGERVNHDAVSRSFGEGENAPLVVVLGPVVAPVDQSQLEVWQRELAAIDGVTNVRMMGATEDRDLAIFQVIPGSGPTDPATEDLVHRLRDTRFTGGWAAPPGVTGLTAINIDLSEALAGATPVYLGIVVALSLVILLLVFRSILVPLAATAGFLLTIGATLGLVVTVFGDERFSWLVGVDVAGPVLSFLPVMATGILYGLAMDYQVFLGTSVREDHLHGAEAREAVITGFRHAGRVVVAAAIIMVSVFGGFVLSSDTTVRQFGFALSAGILIDAFLVRMTLMPALLHLAGERAWWLPAWLERRLPTMDLEGADEPPVEAGGAQASAPVQRAGSK